jgi:hypothetical protein
LEKWRLLDSSLKTAKAAGSEYAANGKRSTRLTVMIPDRYFGFRYGNIEGLGTVYLDRIGQGKNKTSPHVFSLKTCLSFKY